MTGVLGVLAGSAAVVLLVAALLALVRVVRGPTVLARVVAVEVLVSIVVTLLGLEAAYNRHTTTVPIAVALSLVGFVGGVSVARFVAPDEPDDGPGGAPTTLGVDS